MTFQSPAIENSEFSTTRPALATTAAEESRDATFVGDDFLGLLITLIPEVRRACILLALSTYVANSIVRNPVDSGHRSLIKFFPRESSVFILASSRLSRFFGSSPLCRLLYTFNSALNNAKDLTLQLVHQDFPSDSSLARKLELCCAWRDACVAGLVLTRGLQRAMTAFEILGSAKADDSLISLLEQAIRGDGPKGAGGLEMPQWAERRESRRVQVCCPAAIIRAGRRQRGILRNISTTGIGLEATEGLDIGENIVVRIGQSCSLEGTVVWSRGAEAGIKLRRTIQSDDPRLKFCSDD